MPQIRIESINRVREWSGQHGDFLSHYCTALTTDEEHIEVEIACKKGGRYPEIGETCDGELTKGNYGWKFKRSRPAPGEGGKTFNSNPPVKVSNLVGQAKANSKPTLVEAQCLLARNTVSMFTAYVAVGEFEAVDVSVLFTEACKHSTTILMGVLRGDITSE